MDILGERFSIGIETFHFKQSSISICLLPHVPLIYTLSLCLYSCSSQAGYNDPISLPFLIVLGLLHRKQNISPLSGLTLLLPLQPFFFSKTSEYLLTLWNNKVYICCSSVLFVLFSCIYFILRDLHLHEGETALCYSVCLSCSAMFIWKLRWIIFP